MSFPSSAACGAHSVHLAPPITPPHHHHQSLIPRCGAHGVSQDWASSSVLQLHLLVCPQGSVCVHGCMCMCARSLCTSFSQKLWREHGDCRALHLPKPFTGSASHSWFSTLLIAHTLTAAQIRGGVQLWKGGGGHLCWANVCMVRLVCVFVGEREIEAVSAGGREAADVCWCEQGRKGWLLMLEQLHLPKKEANKFNRAWVTLQRKGFVHHLQGGKAEERKKDLAMPAEVKEVSVLCWNGSICSHQAFFPPHPAENCSPPRLCVLPLSWWMKQAAVAPLHLSAGWCGLLGCKHLHPCVFARPQKSECKKEKQNKCNLIKRTLIALHRKVVL